MRGLMRVIAVSGILLFGFCGAVASAADDRGSIVIVFKDGHRQSFAMTEIARMDFKAPAVIVYKDGHQDKFAPSEIARIEFGNSSSSEMMPGRGHFVGKWEVGQGNGSTFLITLDADGEARKTLGSSHGTWTVVDGEARISWDDGWRDVIRKVGTKPRSEPTSLVNPSTTRPQTSLPPGTRSPNRSRWPCCD